MAEIYHNTETETVMWPGASGRKYKYHVHELSWPPAADQAGNYIFARKVANGWEAVYIGQGDLKARKNDHIGQGCVTRNGATHFHAHLNSNETDRLAEESDLLAQHVEVYGPTGCNTR